MRSLALSFFMLLASGIGMTQQARAQVVTYNSIQVSWTTPGDDSLTGLASSFDLRYSTAAITAANFASATRWNGTPVPATSGTRQSATVAGLQPNTTYWFAIKTGDEVPNWAGISNVISRATLAAPDATRPAPITTLTVTGTTETTAALRWITVGDDSLTGTATSHDIRWSTSPITAANFGSATQVTGEPTPTVSGSTQNHTVTGLSRQNTYYFAMLSTDDSGNRSALSNVASATTPDLTNPASIRDLIVGFAWMGWHTDVVAAVVERRQ